MLELLELLRCYKEMFLDDERSLGGILIMRVKGANALAGSEEPGSLRGAARGRIEWMGLVVLDKLL